MNAQALKLPPNFQVVIDRFYEACQTDERVLAATLSGSYAQGTADAYSDLDLGLITTDESYDDFITGRETFMRQLGEPLFLESFDLPNHVFFVFDNGAEGELALGRRSQLNHLHSGPYRVLVDKQNILTAAVFPQEQPTQAEQVEKLRRLVYWFWHDLSHFITAMGRGQLWWAYGQLEILRRMCVDLARLRHNFSDELVLEDTYFKLEQGLPVELIAALQTTFCPQAPEAMLQAAHAIFHFYKELAPSLAQAHGIAYPEKLERIGSERLEKLGQGK